MATNRANQKRAAGMDEIRRILRSLAPDRAEAIMQDIHASLSAVSQEPEPTEGESKSKRAGEFEALMDAVPAMVLVTHDSQCRHISGNKTAAEFLRLPKTANFSKSAPHGKSLSHFRVFKDSHELAPEELPIQIASRGIPVRDFEEEIVFDDGARRILYGNAAPLFDPDGKPRGAVSAFVDITALRQTEEGLRRSEEEFRAMFHLAATANMQATDGKLTRVNKKFCEMLGYTEEELLGQSVFDLIHPDDRAPSLALLARIEDGELGDYQLEKRYVRKDGKTVWGDVHINAMSRAPVRVHATIIDITERRRIETEREAALQHAESLAMELKKRLAEVEERQRILDAMMEHIPTGITVADAPDVAIRMVSKYGRQLIGRSIDETRNVPAEGHPDAWRIFCADRVTPAKAEDLPLTRAVRQGEIVRDEEWVLQRGDGEKITVLCNAGPIRNDEGRITGGVIAWHDISEIKRTEAALRDSEETLVRAQRVGNIGSFDYDLASGNMRWSPQMYEIFGVDPGDFSPSRAALQFIPESDQQKISNAFEIALATDTPYRIEHRVHRADGSERTVLTQGNVMTWDEQGKPQRIVGTTLDVTELRRNEEELRKAQQLESLGLLAGGIAHDFNNILTTIFGNITLARLYAESGTNVLQPLNEAESAFKRAIDLTKQLLTFSKGGAPVRKTASLADLVTDTVKFTLRGSNVQVDFKMAADLWPAKIDEGQISQAINNLVINAKEAMPNGGRLQVESMNVLLKDDNSLGLRAGRYALLRIKDSGKGIPNEQRGRIFDPYFSTKPGGTGLGLTTTYSIVKRHEGYITFNSKPGKGTTFYVYLPASDDALTQAAGPSEDVCPGQGRVLLMDDDASVREVGGRLLERLGYQVQLAADGEQAAQIFRDAVAQDKPFSAVILDLTVPGGVGGRECLHRLREIDPTIKALVSTGYFNDPVVSGYHAYGFQGVIPKPYQLTDLSRALSNLECPSNKNGQH